MSRNKRVRKISSIEDTEMDSVEESKAAPTAKKSDRDFSKEFKQIGFLENISQKSLKNIDAAFDQRELPQDAESSSVMSQPVQIPQTTKMTQAVKVPQASVLQFKDPKMQARPKSVGLPKAIFAFFLLFLLLLVYLLIMEVA